MKNFLATRAARRRPLDDSPRAGPGYAETADCALADIPSPETCSPPHESGCSSPAFSSPGDPGGCRGFSPLDLWRELSTTPQRNLKGQRFRVIHPHHPWYGREFELLTHKQTWGEDRVYFHDERERLVALPAAWTDLLPPDPFIVVANGRSAFRAEDLRELVQLLRKVSA